MTGISKKLDHNGAKDSGTDKWESREVLKLLSKKLRRWQDKKIISRDLNGDKE